MSQMRVTASTAGTFYLNVIAFTSPVYQTIAGVQTKTMAHYFPIKTNQPEIKFTVQFASEGDYELFQDYVRKAQVNALFDSKQPWVTLWWPERNIENWTGFIKEFEAGAQRFSPAPQAAFTVELVESMVSKKATLASFGANFWTLIGSTGEIPWVDKILKPPAAPVDTSPTLTEPNPVSAPPGEGGFGGGSGGGGSW